MVEITLEYHQNVNLISGKCEKYLKNKKYGSNNQPLPPEFSLLSPVS